MFSTVWWTLMTCKLNGFSSFIVLEGVDRGPRPSPEKSQSYSFLSNIGPDPLKLQNYQASIQCWATFSQPVFCWRAENGAGKKVSVGPLW